MYATKNIERVSEDLLDDDFINVFKSCFLGQQLFGTLGVNIDCKFVTPPTNTYKIYCFLIWLINSVCVVYGVLYCETQFDKQSTDTPVQVGFVLNGVVYTAIVWKSIFYRNNHSRCQLYVKLQKIERSLKIKKVKRINGNLQTINWVLFVVTIFLYVTWAIFFNNNFMKGSCPSTTLAAVISSVIYWEIYHVFAILYFISLRVQYVINKLKQAKIIHSQKCIEHATLDYKVMNIDNVGDELVNGMFFILDSFGDTMDIFSFVIFFFTFQMLVWQLISMQNLVVSFKMQMSVNLTSYFCTLSYSLIYMMLMLMLCLSSQSLVTKLDTCAELCTTLGFSLEGKSRENAKRIALLLKGKRNAGVYDIFTLDTQLPLHLLGITASYTIVLLQDILDEDFVKTFTVFLRIQYVLGNSRVEAKDQFVTAPTIYQKLYTVLLAIVITCFNVATVEALDDTVDRTLKYLTFVSTLWVYITYLCYTINARFCNGQENANFFIRLQNLDRLMGIDRIKILNKALKRQNNYSVLTLVISFSIIIILAGFQPNAVYLLFFGSLVSQFAGMIEVLYCSNLLIFFVVRLRFINSIIKNYLAKNENPVKKKYINTLGNKNLRMIAIDTHDFATSDITAYLKELFDCFDAFQRLYRFPLFVFCLKLVTMSLLVFGVILNCFQKNMIDIMEICSLGIYTLIDILVATFLAFRLQLFFGEVKKMKRVSISVMAAHTSGLARDKARKLLKITEETPPKFSIYDMWEMDAGIFVTLFGLITTLIVTVLQFAFL